MDSTSENQSNPLHGTTTPEEDKDFLEPENAQKQSQKQSQLSK